MKKRMFCICALVIVLTLVIGATSIVTAKPLWNKITNISVSPSSGTVSFDYEWKNVKNINSYIITLWYNNGNTWETIDSTGYIDLPDQNGNKPSTLSGSETFGNIVDTGNYQISVRLLYRVGASYQDIDSFFYNFQIN